MTDDAHQSSVGYSSSMYVLDLHSRVSDEKAALLDEQLAAHRREHELDGLVWTDVDVDALTELLAARLSDLCPDPQSVRAGGGMVWVAGAGIDVAQLAADDELNVEHRLTSLAEHALFMSYGESEALILELAPIRLAEIIGRHS